MLLSFACLVLLGEKNTMFPAFAFSDFLGMQIRLFIAVSCPVLLSEKFGIFPAFACLAFFTGKVGMFAAFVCLVLFRGKVGIFPVFVCSVFFNEEKKRQQSILMVSKQTPKKGELKDELAVQVSLHESACPDGRGKEGKRRMRDIIC